MCSSRFPGKRSTRSTGAGACWANPGGAPQAAGHPRGAPVTRARVHLNEASPRSPRHPRVYGRPQPSRSVTLVHVELLPEPPLQTAEKAGAHDLSRASPTPTPAERTWRAEPSLPHAALGKSFKSSEPQYPCLRIKIVLTSGGSCELGETE